MRWRAFPLHPDTPIAGLTLEELFSAHPVDVNKMMHNLKQTAASLGLPFGERKKTYNSRMAQELGLWAESKNRGDAFHLSVFKAYFVDGRNIAKMKVLEELAVSAGLSGQEAASVLATRAFKAAVDADWSLSRKKAITAVPTLVMGRDKLVGAQPYEMMVELLDSYGVEKRETPLF